MGQVHCHCKTHACNGALVSQKVAFSHEQADLHGSMLTSQAQFHAPDVQDPIPEIDLNLSLDLPNLAPKIPNPGGLLAALNYYLDYNTIPNNMLSNTRLTMQWRAIQMDVECEEPNFNHDGSDIEDDDIMVVLLDPVMNEDVPDPFSGLAASPMENDFTDIPSHFIVIYALISWLHLQFHLLWVTCNVLLGIFALILAAVSPAIATPFLTLQSSNCVLGMDKPIYILMISQALQNGDFHAWFARMWWLKPFKGACEDVWKDSESLGVHLWELAKYCGEEYRLLPLVDPDWIQNHLGCMMVSIGMTKQKAWAMVDITKVCCITHGDRDKD
ncbi:hypothetical protein J3A83DRAFT_4187314 [Scleroderma citrinum]